MQNLSKDTKMLLALALTAAGTSAIVSSTIDTAGYDSVCFITTQDTFAAGNISKLQSGNALDMSDAADVASSHCTPTANASVIVIDCVRPPGRYLTFNVTRGTSTRVGEIYAILYNSKTQPISNVTSTFCVTYLANPLTGTA